MTLLVVHGQVADGQRAEPVREQDEQEGRRDQRHEAPGAPLAHRPRGDADPQLHDQFPEVLHAGRQQAHVAGRKVGEQDEDGDHHPRGEDRVGDGQANDVEQHLGCCWRRLLGGAGGLLSVFLGKEACQVVEHGLRLFVSAVVVGHVGR